ncbi:hypothetical protein HBH98_048920 [Parastagonospora nodorum]|nr:hypothetical protein HBH98_048920 [Parastagonospora nodorum]KAH4380195.1 hypothetical protein HBH97_092950 [Parastagonospora nodorum]KAH4424671.1 hypothetical protein HBH99_036510 [Parastagonospora nodorum]KAH4803023.1 hypothetical protein HBH61_180540 [Parastagonospora nodorum]KAH4942170.1 hypothetical protein HBH74_063770 [Parastagonospora nodorum]
MCSFVPSCLCSSCARCIPQRQLLPDHELSLYVEISFRTLRARSAQYPRITPHSETFHAVIGRFGSIPTLSLSPPILNFLATQEHFQQTCSGSALLLGLCVQTTTPFLQGCTHYQRHQARSHGLDLPR